MNPCRSSNVSTQASMKSMSACMHRCCKSSPRARIPEKLLADFVLDMASDIDRSITLSSPVTCLLINAARSDYPMNTSSMHSMARISSRTSIAAFDPS